MLLLICLLVAARCCLLLADEPLADGEALLGMLLRGGAAVPHAAFMLDDAELAVRAVRRARVRPIVCVTF